MISSTEAQLLLDKWLSESSTLRIIFGGKEFGTDLLGRVESLSSEEVHFISDVGRLRLSLPDAEFAYAEPREASSLVREAEEAECVCQLKMWWPSDSVCFLFELRSASP
jgi:hypothetical protein